MKRVLLIGLLLLAWTGAANAWELVLPESVTVPGPQVRLGDIAQGPLPAAAKDLVVQSGRRPGTVETLSRRSLLRRLVTQGLAGGVSFRGAETCRIAISGQEIPATDLTREIHTALAELIPSSRPGAPEPWLETQVPEIPVNLQEQPQIVIRDRRPLEPGRNQVRVSLEAGTHTQEIPVAVVLHFYAETARARKTIARNVELTEELFTWDWTDLALEAGDPALNRDAVLGCSISRSLAPGEDLHASDLKPTPVVRVGDAVELRILRGSVSATVRAFARQAGCLGQTIPVRNELTGRLVNARVTAPGLVEWRQ